MKRANGTGTITKLTGNRRKPYAVKITLGYTEEGKLRYRYLSYHRTRREAEKALAAYNADPYELSKKYTFKELYDEFYAIQEQTKATNTLKNHKAAIKHLEPLWDMKIQSIDRNVLQNFYSNLNVTPSIVNNIHRTLQGVIRHAVKLGVMPLTMLNVQKVLDLSAAQDGQKFEHTLITKEERARLVKVLKALPMKIRSLRGFEEAIITSGGVDLSEINPKTMESKKVKGLRFCGEVLDVDAFTGGFNMQIAFATGYAAGNTIE